MLREADINIKRKRTIVIISAAGILLFLSALFLKFSGTVAPGDFNIVLVTIDTLRADHLSCYGYPRKTSPNIDRIARQGVMFTRAIATSSWTPPSVASIMTSLYPASHGVNSGIIAQGEAYDQEVLSEKFDTLAEILKKKGYTTFAAVANVHMSKELGFDQGFDYYRCEGFVEAGEINKKIFSWEQKLSQSKKYFLWVHYFDPHSPYHARKPWVDNFGSGPMEGIPDLSSMSIDDLKERISPPEENKKVCENIIRLYDSEIGYVDRQLKILVDRLGLDKKTLLIITSDHGEEFAERGSLGHGKTLYREEIQVPLIIKLPFSDKGRVVDETAGIIDIMPTILGLSRAAPPAGLMGIDLLSPEARAGGQESVCYFSDLFRWHVIKSVSDKNWKYIYNFCSREEELYDIAKDPRELNNLAIQEATRAKALKGKLLQWVRSSPKAPSVRRRIQPSQEMKEKLTALGYLSDERQEGSWQAAGGCSVEACHYWY